MKKVLNISLSNRSFTLEEDAYKRLSEYLEHFRARLVASSGVPISQNAEVMEDLESRIAELFALEVGGDGRVVGLDLVDRVTRQLGMPDGKPEFDPADTDAGAAPKGPVQRKIYRDEENRRIGGVCAGLATYLDIDVVLARVLMLVALLAGTAGFWIYIICWIAIPKATTATQKCEMYGLPVTAENLAKFAKTTKKS